MQVNPLPWPMSYDRCIYKMNDIAKMMRIDIERVESKRLPETCRVLQWHVE
jgi:hypothetical protein